MGRTLCGYVYVDGRRWGPGDQPPPEVAEKIRNPKVWSEPETPDPEDPDAGGDTVSGSTAQVDSPAAPQGSGSGGDATSLPDPEPELEPDPGPVEQPGRGRRRRQAA